MTHGGARPGAGRKPRSQPRKNTHLGHIWIGYISKKLRQHILVNLTPEERLKALLDAINNKREKE